MAEAVAGGINHRGLWYKIRAFFNANLVRIIAGSLFALLAIFLLLPIGFVLVRSVKIWQPDPQDCQILKRIKRYWVKDLSK